MSCPNQVVIVMRAPCSGLAGGGREKGEKKEPGSKSTARIHLCSFRPREEGEGGGRKKKALIPLPIRAAPAPRPSSQPAIPIEKREGGREKEGRGGKKNALSLVPTRCLYFPRDADIRAISPPAG